MASVNKVILVGNLGKDPETRSLPSGEIVANFSMATTDKWKDKQTGEMKEATEWHRISVFGRLAEIVQEYCVKGSQIYIEGSLRTRKYQQDGVDKYVTEIRCDTLKLLGGRPQGDGGQGDGGGRGNQQQQQRQPQRQAPARTPQRQAPARSGGATGFDDFPDDIPF